MALVLGLGACSGGDGGLDVPRSPSAEGPQPTAPEPLDVEVTGVTAEAAEDGQVRLGWDPIEEIPGYQVGYGDVAVEVPASVCEAECALVVAPTPAGQVHELTVRATADGAVSEATGVEVEVPARDDAIPPDDELEVVLVSEGDPPEIETVPVGSVEAAQALIDEAYAGELDPSGDRVLLSANLRTAATTDSASSADSAGNAGQNEGDGGGIAAPWQLGAMGYDQLPWERPGEGVTVAVIEMDGLEATHPVFDGADVLDGVNLGDGSQTGLDDPELHATLVTAMIAGQPGTAVPGMAPGATILPVNKEDVGIAEAIVWAVDNGAQVVNLSVSAGCRSFGPFESCPDDVQAAADYAEQQGVVVVASAGNNGDGADHCDEPADARKWPAVLDTVISVGGHDQDREPWVCTPDRPDVDVLAPAAEMLLPVPGGAYTVREGGTSTAAPLVAGLVAAVLAERPDLRPADIRTMLPLWLREDGTIDIENVLRVVEPTDPDTDDFEDAEMVLPYRVDLAFSGTHPVSAALPGLAEPRPSPNTSDVGWTSNSTSGRQQDGKVAFGEIRGLLLVDGDGKVTGSAVFSYEHGPHWMLLQGSDEFDVPGHTLECPSTSYASTSRFTKVFRWDIPIIVRGSLQPGTEDDPALDLTFSFGLGATEDEPGLLPEMTVARDTTAGCKPTLDRGIGTRADPYRDHDTSYDEIAETWEQYEARMEEVYTALVTSSPYTFAEPYQPQFTQHSTVDADDPAVTMVIQHPDTPRRSQF